MVSVKTFCFNAFSENTFILESNQHCIIIDPGCYDEGEKKEIVDYIESHQMKPLSIINTHCHVDHVLGVKYLQEHFEIPFLIFGEENAVLQSVKLYAPVYGFQGYSEPAVDGNLVEGEIIQVGESYWKVLSVPGHSPGHIALYNERDKLCMAGDVLFQRSIGRTDLPGGDFDTLLNSIQTQLFTLPDDVKVYPGHGPETTIIEEKLYNPFCGEKSNI
jgi:glyoxylase-like metal-dependent hydrolase (beta-lactamase superfamily II)